MRIAIVSSSISAATRIYREVAAGSDSDVYALVYLDPNRSLVYHIAKQAALVALRQPRLPILRLLWKRRVRFIRKAPEHPEALALLAKMQFDVGLHNLGIIYRDAMIKAFRLGILNSHIGLLPQYRGRSVMEWSVFHGDPTGITVFFINSGIDTGERIVLREEVDISRCKSIAKAKQYLFDLDAVFFCRALEVLRSENFEYTLNDGSGRRYYVMSHLFQGVVEESLRLGAISKQLSGRRKAES